ncbi:transcription antitermination factor NusB [Mycoplasma leonicaptivi]|uniref:transcription antitermination factor NusB n=1 Tax=Mycoplasma leonicaptivi TaxID=36742 RepID=UPI000482E3A7|nr:transcription antitermination factor NusB [Mycoplasma leonicaptivi]
MEIKTKSMRQQRIEVIQTIYKNELLENKYNASEILKDNYFFTDLQKEKVMKIEKRYHWILEIIKKLMNNDWKWDRISPLIRGIIINAASEMFDIDAKIAINEAIEITKIYFGKTTDENNKLNELNYFKFVNGLLENFYKAKVKIAAYSQIIQK